MQATGEVCMLATSMDCAKTAKLTRPFVWQTRMGQVCIRRSKYGGHLANMTDWSMCFVGAGHRHHYMYYKNLLCNAKTADWVDIDVIKLLRATEYRPCLPSQDRRAPDARWRHWSLCLCRQCTAYTCRPAQHTVTTCVGTTANTRWPLVGCLSHHHLCVTWTVVGVHKQSLLQLCVLFQQSIHICIAPSNMFIQKLFGILRPC